VKNFVDNNPVVVIGGGLVALVNSVLAVLVAFQVVHWTDSQIALVLGLVTSFVAFAATIYTQMAKTTPYVPELDNTPATVVEMRDKLVAAGIEPDGAATRAARARKAPRG
jgi:hypothetical protein